jgi:hypothetical protein
MATVKKYRVRLIAADKLRLLNKINWYVDIPASSMSRAWDKFKVRMLAPLQPVIADDYDIFLRR